MMQAQRASQASHPCPVYNRVTHRRTLRIGRMCDDFKLLPGPNVCTCKTSRPAPNESMTKVLRSAWANGLSPLFAFAVVAVMVWIAGSLKSSAPGSSEELPSGKRVAPPIPVSAWPDCLWDCAHDDPATGRHRSSAHNIPPSQDLSGRAAPANEEHPRRLAGRG